jgi:hypothetical protein
MDGREVVFDYSTVAIAKLRGVHLLGGTARRPAPAGPPRTGPFLMPSRT